MSLIHNIALTFIPEVGHVTAKNLLGHFGSAEAIFKAKRHELLQVSGIGPQTAGHILNNNALQEAEKQLRFVEQHQVKVLFFTDDDYPKRLRNCFDAPILLYYKGTVDLNHPRIISVVGTRRATEYGRQLCRQLAEALASYNVIIVSGLAFGIDIAAHKESLANDIPTIGVLAHGLDRIYPPLHQPVAQKMALNGGLLTEFPLKTIPDKENFPQRNRIIAGISDATILVEATAKGGALITADIANSYNRDVYAFPGRATDVSSEGCNFLIKTNRAALINHTKDLIYQLGWEEMTPKKIQQIQLPLGLSEEELRVVELLKISSARIDELSIQSNIPQSKLAMYLLNLEMQGILVALPGKVYRLN
ncbi:DNA-processing protein DprA [Pedobacter frigoris]|uniref:DNA-protecting protein DprA n=1 Tax=Pedobacter frigoris TaxID=2571272 RepID=A0A4U1CHU3_9SPHI|nr:DNA-processing protein DprA [Pedobacter frigoris]TKC06354.1 DNA-protecting protein DprA [Pedobacter frigoris]